MKINATLVGLCAIPLWSAIVGLIRKVSESFGPTAGAAAIYSVAAVLLFFTVGWPRLEHLGRRYLVQASILFVAYELCLALSIGYAENARQVVEIGIVNYLWPAFTILFAILFNRQASSFLIVPGLLLSLLGACWVLGGEEGLDTTQITVNIASNPLSYGLAFAGALIWATYCTITSRTETKENGITLFFALTALTLWGMHAAVGAPMEPIDLRAGMYLLAAAAAMGFGYAAWNVGNLHGSVTVLAGASYFIPVLSSLVSALLLRAPLAVAFWQGAAMVSIGSILCWLATRNRAAVAVETS